MHRWWRREGARPEGEGPALKLQHSAEWEARSSPASQDSFTERKTEEAGHNDKNKEVLSDSVTAE